MVTLMEIEELDRKLTLRFDRVDQKLDHTNGRVRALEVFKAVVMTVGAIGVLVIANMAAWVAFL